MRSAGQHVALVTLNWQNDTLWSWTYNATCQTAVQTLKLINHLFVMLVTQRRIFSGICLCVCVSFSLRHHVVTLADGDVQELLMMSVLWALKIVTGTHTGVCCFRKLTKATF